MRKLLKILLFIPVLYLLLLPVYIARSTSSAPCGGIAINIIDSLDYHFVTKKHLLSLVYGNEEKIAGKPIRDISVDQIEERINQLKEIKKAEVYITIDGTLHVYVDQRNPIMRVMPDGGGDFFIDDEGIVMRRRNLYTPRLHVVGGNLNISSAMLNGVSVLDTSIKRSMLKDIYHIVSYLNENPFWSAQIDQIFVDNSDEIDLIPRVGNQLIHLGTADNFKSKLRNLEAFYYQVLPEVGWNKYSLINLAYKDQIVCKKR
jgi:cell division protein FtsQ